MSAEAGTLNDAGAAPNAAPVPRRSRAWAIAGTLSVTETVSWGILYYAFSALLVPMRDGLGFSTAELTGAFSMALLISGLAGVAVGRHLDRRSPRPLMAAGSIAGTALVIAWSQVHGLVAFYVVWAGLGLVMAAVLYEPAFVVLAKWFPDAAGRRTAMTAMTLVAALASFIFLPLTESLIAHHGWRDALLVLAAVLGAVTTPAHLLVLRRPPPIADGPAGPMRSDRAREVLRSTSFWRLSLAFFLSTVAGIAVTVHAIAYLLHTGHSASFAAWAAGLIGISQIPGRLLFVPVGRRLSQAGSLALIFSLVAAGIALLVLVHGDAAIVAALVVLGMGNGMSTLARATVLVDRYGAEAYGSIAGVAAFATTGARALAPVAAALLIAAAGYAATLWTLAALAAAAAVLGYRATS